MNWSVMNWSVMNVVCYELVCYDRGLLIMGLLWMVLFWTWSVLECGLLWTWSVMNWSVMNVVCYEVGLLWTGLLWTWSVINGSIMNGSVMNVVYFEWSVLSGLLWADLFWTVTDGDIGPRPRNHKVALRHRQPCRRPSWCWGSGFCSKILVVRVVQKQMKQSVHDAGCQVIDQACCLGQCPTIQTHPHWLWGSL